ncbi:MAG: hypothetical protein U9R54_08210 [Bacteroidota bacterium]|nr:hypothetical protein [Bacteroidota bacterium]
MKEAFLKSLKNIFISVPVILGILMLINLVNPILSIYYSKIFSDNLFLDPLIGAIAGSISFGIPITAYITGGELLKDGVSLLAVTAFVMAWTTVGVAMLPLESKFLGRRFAISRNIVNFFFALIISVLTISILKLF